MIKASPKVQTYVHRSPWETKDIWARLSRFQGSLAHPSHDLGWLKVIEHSFGHRTLVLEVQLDQETIGLLPLAEVNSLLFGKFLVSLPYLNSAGVLSTNTAVAHALIDRAVQLADELDVRYLELRNEQEYFHPQLRHSLTTKTLMRLSLPSSAGLLWNQFKSKLRSQIRSGERNRFSVHWGGTELLDNFYQVFSHKMRDLGTPVYSKRLFRSILEQFPDTTELCCLHSAAQPIAVALLIHGREITEVPSASSLSEYNSKNANMLMYWHLLQRAIARGNRTFDFGRSTINGNTYRFKKQWGAIPSPSVWQYYLRKGQHDALRPESRKYSLAIATWRRLPVKVTQWIGPSIVRGIP